MSDVRGNARKHLSREQMGSSPLLHDIGKLDISRDLLYKAARLTAEEYEAVQQHVAKGVE